MSEFEKRNDFGESPNRRVLHEEEGHPAIQLKPMKAPPGGWPTSVETPPPAEGEEWREEE